MDHKCKPKPMNFFGTTQWQCGCGRYFSKKTAAKILAEREKESA